MPMLGDSSQWRPNAPIHFCAPFVQRGSEIPKNLKIGDGFWRTIQVKGKFRLLFTDVPAQQVAALTTFI